VPSSQSAGLYQTRSKKPLLVSKNAVKKVGGAVKSVAKGVATAAKGVATAAKKTVNYIKKNGATFAKVAFKAVAAASKAASHVVAVIPGIGKPVGQALKQISQVSDFVSSQIPAKMSSGWQKAMNVMEKVENPLGTGVAGKVFDAVLKRDDEEDLVKRSMMEGEVLYERDFPELEIEARSFGDDVYELEARSLDGDEIEARSFDDSYDLEARSSDDGLKLEARSWDFEVEE